MIDILQIKAFKRDMETQAYDTEADWILDLADFALGNTAALAEAIILLMDDAERRSRYGAAGRARMRREFSVATMAEKHVQLYERLLSD